MARFGILTTHPIQYYAPWFRYLAERHDMTVYYAHAQDADGQAKAGFGVRFEWDVPLLQGYHYQWLSNVSKRPCISKFAGCDTPEISEEIAQGQYDAFLVTGWNKKSYWQALRACKRSGTPVLCRGDSQLVTPRPRWQTTLKYLPYRLLLPQFDVHLYVGQRNREYLRHYGVRDAQLSFCPHFVDNDFFQQRALEACRNGAAKRVRSEYGIPDSAFVLLYVGKFIDKKRVSDVVDATTRLLSADRAIHLMLVGDGPLRPELERAAGSWRSNIHFAGFRNQKELPAYYAASSATALASDGGETWGLVVNEAMASGLPCIVSDAVGCRDDMIVEGETGYSYRLGDVDALASRLARLVTDCRNDPDRMKMRVLSRISEYSLERATDALEQTLQQLNSSRRSVSRCSAAQSIEQ